MGRSTPTPTTEQFTAFQKQFDHFNRVLYGGRLPAVLFNFSRKANTYGFFAPDRWKNADGTTTHEISLNPAYLAERAPEATSSTIVHEMAHLWQHEHGTPSRRGYHNEQWAVKMRELGLMPSSTGKPGGEWVGYHVSHYIVDGGKFERAFRNMPKAYLFPWVSREQTTAGKAKKAQRDRIKYTCPACNQNIWAKPGMNVMCIDDQATYEPQEAGPGLPTKVERGPVWMPGVRPPERNGARCRHELRRIVRSRPQDGGNCRARRSLAPPPAR